MGAIVDSDSVAMDAKSDDEARMLSDEEERFSFKRKRETRARPRSVRRRVQLEQDLDDLRDANVELYEAVVCSDPREIVRKAVVNRHNRTNLPLLEWAEGVLLQLCHFHEPLNLEQLTWNRVLEILQCQWRREVMHPLTEMVGRYATLDGIVRDNHEWKLRNGLILSDSRVFHKTPPTVAFRVLRRFSVKTCLRPRQTGKPPAISTYAVFRP